jgi:hypothetical protein
MSTSRQRLAWVLVALVLLAAVAAWHWWPQVPQPPQPPGLIIAGGDGGGLPRATPEQEGLDAKGLDLAVSAGLGQGARALLITRHGHLLVERYARGTELGTLFDGGELSQALLMIASGVAVQRHGMSLPEPPLQPARFEQAIAAASGRSYPDFVSREIWRPVHAASARWTSSGVSARGVDWLRVAQLLMHDGRFEGTQVVQAGWIPGHLGLVTGPDAETPAGREQIRLRGAGATRLWLVPRLDLAILSLADAPPAGTEVDESLVRRVITTIRDLPATGGHGLNDLVPGH